MKNIVKYIALSIGLILTASSCSDFLEESPSDSKYVNESIKNLQGAETALNGVYHLMAYSTSYGRDMTIYGDYKGGDFGLTTTGIAGDALYFFTHTTSSGSSSGSTFWTQGYKILQQTNNIIESIELGKVVVSTEADQTALNNVHAQALAIRALVHFDLTRLYGYPYSKDKGAGLGVPIVTKVLPSGEKPKRNTVAECYTRVITDLTDALLLYDEPATKKNGRIYYYGAKALLARVYLYKHDWENAYSAAKDVIDNGGYTAYTAASWVDSWAKQGGTESIFELLVLPNESDLGRTSPRAYFAPRNMGELNKRNELGPIMVSDQFLEMFKLPPHDTDARWGIFGLDEFGNGQNTGSRLIPGRKGWLMKYEGDGKNPASAVNIKIIRLTEVLMVGAEAALKKNTKDVDSAVEWINKVRSRNAALADLTTSEPEANLLAEIELQRRIDLIGEGHRFFDVLRNGGTVHYTDGGVFPSLQNGGRGSTVDWDFNKIVLPIFIDELNINPNIRDQQNPGY